MVKGAYYYRYEGNGDYLFLIMVISDTRGCYGSCDIGYGSYGKGLSGQRLKGVEIAVSGMGITYCIGEGHWMAVSWASPPEAPSRGVESIHHELRLTASIGYCWNTNTHTHINTHLHINTHTFNNNSNDYNEKQN